MFSKRKGSRSTARKLAALAQGEEEEGPEATDLTATKTTKAGKEKKREKKKKREKERKKDRWFGDEGEDDIFEDIIASSNQAARIGANAEAISAQPSPKVPEKESYTDDLISQLKSASKRRMDWQNEVESGTKEGATKKDEEEIFESTERKPFVQVHFDTRPELKRHIIESEGDLEWEQELLKRSGALKDISNPVTTDPTFTDRAIRRGSIEQLLTGLRNRLSEKQSLLRVKSLRMHEREETIKQIKRQKQQAEIDLTHSSNVYEAMQSFQLVVNGIRACLTAKQDMIASFQEAMQTVWEDEKSRNNQKEEDVRGALLYDALSLANAFGVQYDLNGVEVDKEKVEDVGDDAVDSFGRSIGALRREGKKQSLTRWSKGKTPEERMARILEEEHWSSPRRKELLEGSQLIFEDVDDRFANYAKWMPEFVEWKARFPKEYERAYVDLALPGLLKPYLDIELFQVDWWEGFRIKDGELDGDIDPLQWLERLKACKCSATTLQKVCETTFVPIMEKVIKLRVNAFSAKDIAKCLFLLKRLLQDQALEKSNAQSIISMVCANLEAQAKQLCIPTFTRAERAGEELADAFQHLVIDLIRQGLWLCENTVTIRAWADREGLSFVAADGIVEHLVDKIKAAKSGLLDRQVQDLVEFQVTQLLRK